MKPTCKAITTLLLLLSIILLMGCRQEVQITDGSVVTRTGTVTDRAMAYPDARGKIWGKSYPYITVEFEDGSALCIWNMRDVDVPDDIRIGTAVEITYTTDGSQRAVLVSIRKINP